MPGAADAVPDHETLSERAVVMAAMRVDGENLRTGPHQNDILITDVPEQGVGGELAQCDALDEIRASGRLLFSHDPSPPLSSHPAPDELRTKPTSTCRTKEFLTG